MQAADEVPVDLARARLGKIVTAAARDQQVTMITKYGVPAAFVISART